MYDQPMGNSYGQPMGNRYGQQMGNMYDQSFGNMYDQPTFDQYGQNQGGVYYNYGNDGYGRDMYGNIVNPTGLLFPCQSEQKLNVVR